MDSKEKDRLLDCMDTCVVCYNHIIGLSYVCSTCSSTSCESCVKKWNYFKKKCPTCRSTFKDNYSLSRSSMKIAKVLNLGLQCKHPNCTKVCRNEDLALHMETCPNREVVCCKWASHDSEKCRHRCQLRNFIEHLRLVGITPLVDDPIMIDLTFEDKALRYKYYKTDFNIVQTYIVSIDNSDDDSDSESDNEGYVNLLVNHLLDKNMVHFLAVSAFRSNSGLNNISIKISVVNDTSRIMKYVHPVYQFFRKSEIIPIQELSSILNKGKVPDKIHLNFYKYDR